MNNIFNLSPASLALFMKIVINTDFDRGFDEGCIYERELGLTKELRGNLSDLKKKGLLNLTFEYDMQRIIHRTALYWVNLTEKGQELAKKLNII